MSKSGFFHRLFCLFLVSVTALTLSSITLANATVYDLQIDSSFSFPPFPGLDLHDPSSAVLTASVNNNGELDLARLEIVFPRATNLVVSGFKSSGNSPVFRGVKNNAWVYRQVMIEVDLPPYGPIFYDTPVSIRGYVVANASNLNNLADAQNVMIFDLQARVQARIPRKLADTARVNIAGKAVNMRLYQSIAPVTSGPNSGQFGFDLNINWLGNGEKDVIDSSFAPCPPGDCKAIAINVTPVPDLPIGEYDWIYEIEYEDMYGGRNVTPPQSLRMLLDQHFPPVF